MAKKRVDHAGAKATAEPAGHVDAIFRALASAPRRQILAMLATGAGDGDGRCCGPYDVCACRFAEDLQLTPQTVSHHVRVLQDAGLVTSRKEGLWVYYRLLPSGFKSVTDEVSALLESAEAIACCASVQSKDGSE
jgi:DNA-binding transcriptional ArsR family regulator